MHFPEEPTVAKNKAKAASRKPATRPAAKTAGKPVSKAAAKTAGKTVAGKKPAQGAARAAVQDSSRRGPGKLKLSMMTGDYEIVRALKDGTVRPKGIELVIGSYPGTADIHRQVADGKGCDINEYNGGHYVVQKAYGRADVTAIPVFLHRRFRHGFIYINKSKGIAKPSDLVGRRIGSISIGAAANYWMRGHLEDFGVPHRSVTWVIERSDEASRQAPKGLNIEMTPPGKSAEELLLRGDIDAMVSPSINRMIDENDPRVGRLWPNYREVEVEYYKRTGFFPVMHVTTVPSEIVAKYPWVVESLVMAFEEAKQLAYQRLSNPRIVPLAFYRSAWEEQRELLGPDPWEYGLSAINRKNYDRLVGYVHEQVLTGPRPTLRDLFAKESFELELPLPTMHEIKHGF